MGLGGVRRDVMESGGLTAIDESGRQEIRFKKNRFVSLKFSWVLIGVYESGGNQTIIGFLKEVKGSFRRGINGSGRQKNSQER